MSDIQALEGRITAALDRIRYSTERLAQPVAAPIGDQTQELEALRAQLEDERTANAQLEERVKILHDREEQGASQVQSSLAEKTAALAGMEAEIERLRASNAELQEMNSTLRTAASEGAASAELINRATLAEVEALTAQRSADAAEIDAILGALKPLIEEA